MTDSASGNSPTAPSRPRAWLTTVDFTDGTSISLASNEIIVIVGPNNAGKSVALREIDEKLIHLGGDGLVVRGIEIEAPGSDADFMRWADTVMKQGSGQMVLPTGLHHRASMETRWRNRPKEGLRDL